MAYFLFIPFSIFKFSWKLHEISIEFLPFSKISLNFNQTSDDFIVINSMFPCPIVTYGRAQV